MQFVLQQVTSLDFWTFIVAFLALIATAYFGHKTLRKQDQQLKLAHEEAARRPALEIAEVGLVPANQVKQVKETFQSKDYDGPYSDRVLAVTLTNKGKDPALNISGLLYIKHPLSPFVFPGLTSDIRIHSTEPWLHVVAVEAPTGYKLRQDANFDRLGFSIAVRIQTQEPVTTQIKYIFTPQQGDSAEGVWHLDVLPP